MTLIVGQVEALLPKLLEAMETQKSATAEVDRLKNQIIGVIESPQTVKTCWGSVTLNRGRRTVKVTDRAISAQITLLKESGIALGKCEESVGDPFITVRKSDRWFTLGEVNRLPFSYTFHRYSLPCKSTLSKQLTTVMVWKPIQ